MVVEVIGIGAGDATAREEDATAAVVQDTRDFVEGCGIEPIDCGAEVVKYRFCEVAEPRAVAAVLGPSLMLADRLLDAGRGFVAQGVLKFWEPFEAKLAGEADHGWRRHPGRIGDLGDRFQARDRVVAQEDVAHLSVRRGEAGGLVLDQIFDDPGLFHGGAQFCSFCYSVYVDRSFVYGSFLTDSITL